MLGVLFIQKGDTEKTASLSKQRISHFQNLDLAASTLLNLLLWNLLYNGSKDEVDWYLHVTQMGRRALRIPASTQEGQSTQYNPWGLERAMLLGISPDSSYPSL